MAKNMGANYSHRVTLRLNDAQYTYLISIAEILGVSPSDYMRMSINAGMVQTKEMVEKGEVGKSYENFKTDINNIV